MAIGGQNCGCEFLRFSVFNSDALGRNVVEAVDVKGCGLVPGYDDVGIAESPLKPMAEEVSLEPAVMM